MEKVNRALLQYFQLDYTSHIETFKEMLPEGNETIFYLPTKNILDYILLRTQGVAKLMCRVVHCARAAAVHMEGKMSTGQSWRVAFLCFAIVSRVWVLAKDAIKFCCMFFDAAVAYSDRLKNTTSQWLDRNYVFPRCLQEWLGADGLEESVSEVTNKLLKMGSKKVVHNMVKEEKIANGLRGFDTSEVVFENVGHSAVDLEESRTTKVEPISNKKRQKNKTRNKRILQTQSIINDGKAPVKRKQVAKSLDEVTSFNTTTQLKTFLKYENNARENRLSSCLLKNLDKLQWNMVQNKLKKLIFKADRSDSVAIAKQLIENAKQIIKDCANT